MSRSALSPNSDVSDQWAAPTTSAVFTAIRRIAETTTLVPSLSLSAGRYFPMDRVVITRNPPKSGPICPGLLTTALMGATLDKVWEIRWNLYAHDRPRLVP